jgi:hypothetical protein
MFNQYDLVRIKWLEKYKENDFYYGIPKRIALRLEKEIVIIQELVDEITYRISHQCVDFNGWLVPSSCLYLAFENKDDTLKHLNSRDNATHCAQCGEKLKEPYPRIKFCSRCE